MTADTIEILFGTASLVAATIEQTEELLKALEELHIDRIDTAEVYGDAEAVLGKSNATSRFRIDTKISAAAGPVPMTKEVVLDHARESLRKLNAESVDVYYLHAPDNRVPFQNTLEGINQLYKEGAFKRFGLSNHLPHELEEVVRICKEYGYVLPSVFQGNYSPIARRPDEELFPILRKHNIAFYAYSPIAGGFLTKTREILTSGKGVGRWDPKSAVGKLYISLYQRPSFLDALDKWGEIAREEGVSKAELAYRWVAFNSKLKGELGDGVVFGAFSVDHLRETVGWLRKGPLSLSAAEEIDEIWDMIKSDAIWDNYNSFTREHGDLGNSIAG